MAKIFSKPTLVRVGSNNAPLDLTFDFATPHQISIKATQTRTLAANSTARVDYRVAGATTWADGGYLYNVKTSEGSSFAGFAGWIVGLTPGTNYDVRIQLSEPGNAVSWPRPEIGGNFWKGIFQKLSFIIFTLHKCQAPTVVAFVVCALLVS